MRTAIQHPTRLQRHRQLRRIITPDIAIVRALFDKEQELIREMRLCKWDILMCSDPLLRWKFENRYKFLENDLASIKRLIFFRLQ